MNNHTDNTGKDKSAGTGNGNDNFVPGGLHTDNEISAALTENAYNANGDISANEDGNDDTDKYLAMEQPGVQYTQDTEPTNTSDNLDFSESNKSDNKWNEEGGNSLNSNAFNQDDYLLEDNVDFDEDQSQSVSSDDEDFEELNERY